MDTGSVTLLRIRGIPIRAHWSLLVALVYATVSLSANFSALAQMASVPTGHVALPPLAWGALVAAGLFISVALHELAHSLFAVRVGGRVREITLMMIGGVSRIDRMPPTLRLEGWMAVVGPLSSLAIAAVLWMAWLLSPQTASWADLRLGFFLLASLNLSLGIFNLLPAFPMDGGRVFRAIVGRFVGRSRATQIAAAVGRAMAVLFGVVGVIGGNVILIIIAVFLFSGASAESAGEEFRALLGDARIRDLMTSSPLVVGLGKPLAEVGAEMRQTGCPEAVVLDSDDRPVGVLHIRDFARATGADARVGDLTEDLLERVTETVPDDSAEEALQAARQHRSPYLVVVDRARASPLLGLVGPVQLQVALALRGMNARPPVGAVATELASSHL